MTLYPTDKVKGACAMTILFLMAIVYLASINALIIVAALLVIWIGLMIFIDRVDRDWNIR